MGNGPGWSRFAEDKMVRTLNKKENKLWHIVQK